MCGIVGYIGSKDARGIIIKGLKKLEYRGYDSAGIALLNNKLKEICIYKEKGRISELVQTLDYDFETNYGIGHTRWATHGKPNKINCHPHCSGNGRFIIVHNGVIENFKHLILEKLKGHCFKTDTDTEIIAHLIEHYNKSISVEAAIRKSISMLEGSYALLIIDKENTDRIYIAKNKTPLLLGISDHGISIASDAMALAGNASEYVIIEDQSFGVIKNDSFHIYDIIGNEREIIKNKLNLKAEDISKGTYPHYMLKEIDEQPGVIRRIISKYFEEDKIKIDPLIEAEIRKAKRIHFIAAGTSMHAGYVGKYLFETVSGIPCDVHIASEFAYNVPYIVEGSLFIIISQSGETADSISALKIIRERNYPSITITNVSISSLAREANYFLPILAGHEISVASTKAYTGQVAILSILSFLVSNKKVNLKYELTRIALAIEDVFNTQTDLIKQMVETKIGNSRNCFYIGRGLDYYVALEAALKLKEISYIQTEGFASGELKHGTIALIEKDTPVIAIITQENINLNTRNNLKEVETRGAKCAVISCFSLAEPTDDIVINDVLDILAPLVSVVVTQLIAYYSSILRGNDVDKPRNLAKSVTVE